MPVKFSPPILEGQSRRSQFTRQWFIGKRKKTASYSCATISECNRHDPSAIIAHMEPLASFAKDFVPRIKHLHIVSDGPTTQYRNKVMFQLVSSCIPEMFGVNTVHWHFTESSHGKGAPDGVGGYLKRTADSLVGMGKDIPNHTVLLELLKDKCRSINIWPIEEQRIEDIDKVLPQCVKPFEGTMKIHELFWKKGVKFMDARRLSCTPCYHESRLRCKHYGLGQIEVLKLRSILYFTLIFTTYT